MTLTEIYFNYSKAIRQAEKLEEVARKLRDQANDKMAEILKDVKAAWESDNSSAYLRKGVKVQGDIVTTARNLENIASAIRKIAIQIRNAELEAWRIANERKM